MSIWTQKSALIQLRTSLLKFDDLAEKSEKSSVSNFSTEVYGKWEHARGSRDANRQLDSSAAFGGELDSRAAVLGQLDFGVDFGQQLDGRWNLDGRR